jgi:dTDP-4-amino-4,6-dideoxygalactose transaminase
VYSFYATKHVNTGEGAALLAADAGDQEEIRRLRRFGIDPPSFRLPNGDLNPRFDITLAGFNLQMNEIAATLGLEGMLHADGIVARHRANGLFYETALADIPGLRQLKRRGDSMSGYWTYSLLAERRDDLIRKLASHGIGAQRLHVRTDGYSCFGGKQSALPGVAGFDAHNVSIPCGWWVGDEERERVAQCLRAGW